MRQRRTIHRGWLLILVIAGGVALLRSWTSPAAEEARLRVEPLKSLEQRVASGSADFRAAFVLGERLVEADRDADAERVFRKLIGADATNWVAYVRLGLLLARTGRQSEAFQVLSIPVARAPHLVEGHRALADLYLTRQAYPQAIRELQAVVQRDANQAEAWYQLSQCYDALSQPSRARDMLQEAVRRDPRNSTYHVELARILRKQGQVDGALSHLHEALAINPDSAAAHYTLGETLAEQPGQSGAAESEFRAALKAAPGFPPARYQLGLIAMRRRDWKAAAAEFEEALKVAPRFKEATFQLAQACDRLARTADATRLRKRFIMLTEQEQQILDLRARIGFGRADAAAYGRLARAYRDAGQPDRAAETLVSARQRWPHDPAVRSELRLNRSMRNLP